MSHHLVPVVPTASRAALRTPSFVPDDGYGYDGYYVPYRDRWHEEPVACLDKRSATQVLGNLTITYLIFILAYVHLQRSLQHVTGEYKIPYRVAIFVIFPLYPAISLAIQAFRAIKAWRLGGRVDYTFLLSRIAGLEVTRHGGQSIHSEALDTRHLRDYNWSRERRPLGLMIAHAAFLSLATVQCLSALIRTSSRGLLRGSYWGWIYVFLAADFETFFMSIGALAICIKSWLALGLNVQWTTDLGLASRAVDISSRGSRSGDIFSIRDTHVTPAEIVWEVFLEFYTRAIVLTVLFIAGWVSVGIVSRSALIGFIASFYATVLFSIIWLQRSEAEALPSGKDLFVSGFCGTIPLLVPRIRVYAQHIDDFNGLFRFFGVFSLVVPLIVLGIAVFARIWWLRKHEIPYSARGSKLSHLSLVLLGTISLVIWPAYILSLLQLRLENYSSYCRDRSMPDPFWTPGFG